MTGARPRVYPYRRSEDIPQLGADVALAQGAGAGAGARHGGTMDHMHAVRNRVARGVPLERIEAYIDNLPGLDENERAVLWLYAWVECEPGQVRQLIQAEVVAPG